MARTLTVVAEMIAAPGKEEELRKQLMSLIEPTRREDGCVQYDLHEATDQPGRFVFYENWTGQDALDRHMATPHFQSVAAAIPDLLSVPAAIVTYRRIA